MAGAFDLVASWARQHPVLSAVVGIGSLTFLWFFKLNLAMTRTHPEAAKYATESPWTEDVIRKTYDRLKANPIDVKAQLPPKLDRRYVVVGGSGLVGGFLVTALLERGHPPAAIRIIDFRAPEREDLITGLAAKVEFVQGDMTSSSSVVAAFTKPWDRSVASLPLTVLHTAAVLQSAADRSPLVYDRSRIPNVVGATNAMFAAKAVGASVFILTSSAGISMRSVTWFTNPPWRFWPHNLVQFLDDHDFFQPLLPHTSYFSNYGRSKAEAERLVCAADSKVENFRTGAIRPGNGVYGHEVDLLVGYLLREGSRPTFSAPWVQGWINGHNLAISHLQLEAALLGPHADASKIAGRPFVVTDPGPPPVFEDTYTAARVLSKTPVEVSYPPPVLLLLLSAAIESWCQMIRRMPWLTRLGLSEPGMPMYYLQTPIFDASVNYIIDDSDARKSPEEGGIGYKGVCTTMEGICGQLVNWNRMVEAKGAKEAKKGR